MPSALIEKMVFLKLKLEHIKERIYKIMSETRMNHTNNIISIAPKMLTIREVPERTGISQFHIRRLLKDKQITHIRAGKKYLINFDKFIEYLNNGDS